MKTILITQKQFKKEVQKAMCEYTYKMKKGEDDTHKYDAMMQLADGLTMSLAFALLEYNLFHRRDEDE